MSAPRQNLGRWYPELEDMVLRLTALFILAVLIAAGLTTAGLVNVTVAQWMFNVAAGAGAGIFLGLASRVLFRERSIYLRWMAAAVALCTSLVLLGVFSWGYIGIGLYPDPQRPPDWAALDQILIGSITITLAQAARRPRPRVAVAAIAESGSTAGGQSANLKPNAGRLASPPARLPVITRLLNRLRLWLSRGRNNAIRLVGAEERRCPYCLQPIVNRDPRGVVTCPVCHTRHHKDCWNITGMCQVPHAH
jgi:hypothetical protein